MNPKEFIAIIMLFIMVFIGVATMSISYGANVDVVSDFDNNTLTTVELSESQSKTIWGFENLAKVQTRTGGDMQNTHIETDEGLWNYEYMILNDTIMDRNDRVYGKNGDQTLYAHYTLTPYCYADITIIDEHGNAGGFVNFPRMTDIGDSVTHTFKPFIDYDDIHYEPFFIQDMDTKQVYQPNDNFTVTYSDCLANNYTIHKVFQYVYGYYPDYTVNFISINNETGEVFDNVTEIVNRANWSSYYELPNAPEVAHKVLDYVLIVEDGITNYVPGNTYEAMYDMAMSEGNNLTRTFIYFYKEGEYANVTVNFIINATGSEYDGLTFNNITYPYLVVGEELIGGYVIDYPVIHDFEFVSVTYSEVIINGVKAMLPGSDVTDIGGFWLYEVTDNGNIDLNFVYNYAPIKVDPTPEPIPTPGNDTIPTNDTNETEPVIPDVPVVPEPIVPENETKGDDNNVPNMDNISNNNDTANLWNSNTNSNGNSRLSDEQMVMKQTGNSTGWLMLFAVIILFALICILDRRKE